MSWIEVSKLMRIANSVILIMSFFGLLRIFIAYFFQMYTITNTSSLDQVTDVR